MRFLLAMVLLLCLFTGNCLAQFTLELENSSFAEFVNWYAQSTGSNIVIADGVGPAVNIAAFRLENNDAKSLFDSILAANKLSSFIVGSVTYIVPFVPEKEPAKNPPEVYFHNFKNVSISSVYDALSVFSSSFASLKLARFDGINTVSLVGDPLDVLMVRKFVDVLDKTLPSVRVEAIVVEISDTDTHSMGVDLSFLGSHVVASSLFANVSDLSGLPSTLVAGLFSAGDYQAVLRALSTSDQVKLLSTPSILVRPGDTGRVFVGDNVPIITGRQASAATPADQPFQEIQRADVGIMLSVRPVVISGRLVSLEIIQEASSVSDSTLAADIITRKREIRTKVDIEPGKVLVLGGLISDDFQAGKKGVPLLQDLPWVGRLFRSSSSSATKRNLNVFLRVTLS